MDSIDKFRAILAAKATEEGKIAWEAVCKWAEEHELLAKLSLHDLHDISSTIEALLRAKKPEITAITADNRAPKPEGRTCEGPEWSTGLPENDGLYLARLQDGDLVALEYPGMDWLIVKQWVGPFQLAASDARGGWWKP